jgi:uncharacterized protein YndB with AHSA1/START domain
MGIPIQMSDETFIPLSPVKIWPVLANISRYHKWWPRSLFVHLLHSNPGLTGTKYSIRPYGWRSFSCEIVSVEETERICLQYGGNYMKGAAEWRLKSINQGTLVIYDMDAEVNDLLVALVGKVISLKSIHSYSMRAIFQNLKKQL